MQLLFWTCIWQNSTLTMQDYSGILDFWTDFYTGTMPIRNFLPQNL